MVSTRAVKRTAVDNNLLQSVDILRRVLSYVGPGHGLFLSSVSTLWRDLYCRVASRTMQKWGYGFGTHMRLADFTCTPKMTLYAAVFASPSCVKLAHESGLDISTENFRHAAGKHADIATLKAAHELGMHFTGLSILGGAAEGNKLAVVQFLHAQGCPWHWSVASAAAKRNDLEMLRWVREHGCKWNARDILTEAAGSGNIEMMTWVKQQPGVVYGRSVMTAAARKGRTAVCEYLKAQQCPWDTNACDAAAYEGHVSTLRWLQENGCPWDANSVCAAAAAGGSVQVMQYLQQEGVAVEASTLTSMLNAAGSHDKLAAALWLRERGAAWPERLNLYGREWSGDTLALARAAGCTATTEEWEY
jgi:hypothetical protein